MAQEQKSDDCHEKEQEQKRQRQQRQEEEDEDEEKEESPAPSKAPRASTDKSWDADTVTTAVASPLVLGLGLSVGAKEREEVGPSSSSSAKAGFTFMQMQEFHHQALIFKHMVAGIPVPIHLILPIWKSVAASYGPHHYPSFVGLGNLCYDFRNSMEPEPGRCRRTDGKKWRCSRDVVPEQKYCERHMHRGRNRSRKPVEATAAAAAVGLSSSSSPPPPTNNNSNLSITIPDDDAIPSTNSTGNLITSSNALTARIIGSSPTSVLSATPACKTGAS